MGIDQVEIIILACLVSTACVLPGVFLVLRQVSLMSDAISHSILLGIVVAFLWVKDLHSPWLMIAATITGILTVSLTELVIKSRRLKEDAAIGLVFPVFFSIGVILINQFAGNVHIDQDAVLLGEIAFAPFNRWGIRGIDLGPISIWVMSGILLFNLGFVFFLYKELKLATFDKGLAISLGVSPVLVHYGLMTMVSMTAVGAFDAVGSILVVALMIAPPATAYLVTERLSRMILWSVVFGIVSAVLGYFFAAFLDVSIAGSMATMTGVLFVLALCFSTKRGLVTTFRQHRLNRMKFAVRMLVVQLLDHEGTELEGIENTVTNLVSHMGWTDRFAVKITGRATAKGFITRSGDRLFLTPLGREVARDALAMS